MDIHESMGGMNDNGRHSRSSGEYVDLMKIKPDLAVQDHTEITARGNHR